MHSTMLFHAAQEWPGSRSCILLGFIQYAHLLPKWLLNSSQCVCLLLKCPLKASQLRFPLNACHQNVPLFDSKCPHACQQSSYMSTKTSTKQGTYVISDVGLQFYFTISINTACAMVYVSTKIFMIPITLASTLECS